MHKVLAPTLVLKGGNRGADSVLRSLTREAQPHRVEIDDPVPERAQRLLDRYGLTGLAREIEAEFGMDELDRNALVVACTDNAATNQVVWDTAGSTNPTALQTVIRTRSGDSQPGAVLGLSALHAPNRHDDVIDAVFEDLGSIPRGRSSDFSDDRFSERDLASTRAEVGRVTARAILEPEQRLDDATPHRLVYRGREWALLAVEGEAGSFVARQAGEDAAHDRGLADAAVLVRSARSAIDVVIVRRGRGVRFPLYRPPELARPDASGSDWGLIGLGALAALALGGAVALGTASSAPLVTD